MGIVGIWSIVFDITVRIPETMDTEKLDETEVDNDKTKRGGAAKCSKWVVLEVTVNWCETIPIGKYQWEFRRDLA